VVNPTRGYSGRLNQLPESPNRPYPALSPEHFMYESLAERAKDDQDIIIYYEITYSAVGL